MTRYTADDIRGLVAIVPTPGLPGADRWDGVDTVDLAETERMVEGLVAAGVDAIMTNGTFGEGATLTLPEVLAFNDTVIQTVAHRVPVFTGATTLNTRDTIARGRLLADLGADGLFLGRPMWVALDGRQIVDYHRSVAEALPQLSQVLYDNPIAFRGKISSDTYAELSHIPQVVASKHLGVGLMGDRFLADLRAVEGRMRLLCLAEDWYPSASAYPDEMVACWSGDAVCGPNPLILLRRAVLARDWDAAAAMHAEIVAARSALFPGGDFELFSRYNLQIDRAQFAAAGWMTPGPLRPPYTSCPEDYLEGGRETGRRWAALHARYAAVPTA